MVVKVSQEMFDNTVKENMEQFEINVTEAIQDTVAQFNSQGADLSAVIVDMMAANMNSDVLKEADQQLKILAELALCKDEEIIKSLQIIQTECQRGITYRVIAGKLDCYATLMKMLKSEEISVALQSECLRTLLALMTNNPDILDEQGIAFIIATIKHSKNEEVLRLLLEWTKECCTMHEFNRQHIVDAGILAHLEPLVSDASSQLLCAVLDVLRALVLDDDVRVEFGRAHEHARLIANGSLAAITALLEKYKDDVQLIDAILRTLSALLVRSEFCQQVVDANGLAIIRRTLQEFSTNEKLTRQCFKVLKALAGNDDCKAKIVKTGAAPLIVDALHKNQDSAPTVALGLACIASLTLRSTDNSAALHGAGAPMCIIECMKRHSENEAVQKNASWAIRNMVSRSRHQNTDFLRLGAEALLKGALAKFRKSEYDIKSALRDLECTVDLKEEWTGSGGKLTTSKKAQ